MHSYRVAYITCFKLLTIRKRFSVNFTRFDVINSYSSSVTFENPIINRVPFLDVIATNNN